MREQIFKEDAKKIIRNSYEEYKKFAS